MPSLPVLSGRQIVRTLERLGFTVARHKGSHIVMQRGSAGCVVPQHREVKIDTLAALLRQAGVTHDEFLQAASQ